jgi:hypothetical protein
VHHGSHGTHQYDIQVLATHASTWVMVIASPSGRNMNYDEKQLTGEKIFLSCSFYLYRFRKYVSYGFPIINYCNPGVHFETPCVINIVSIYVLCMQPCSEHNTALQYAHGCCKTSCFTEEVFCSSYLVRSMKACGRNVTTNRCCTFVDFLSVLWKNRVVTLQKIQRSFFMN